MSSCVNWRETLRRFDASALFSESGCLLEGNAYSYSSPFLQHVVRSGARQGVARRGRHIVSLILVSSEWIAAFNFRVRFL